jgi:hypothetical protein
VEIKIEGKLSSGELILRQGYGNENLELTLCQPPNELTVYVGAEEFARVVKFLSEVNRAYNV